MNGGSHGRGADFATALRLAVATRGLSLENLRRQLGVRGHRLSVATLSYWQSGRSVPERAASLAALGVLEEILELPPGSLVNRLPPGGRRSGSATPSVLLPTGPLELATSPVSRESDPMVLRDLAAQLDLDWDSGLDRVFVHDRLVLRDDRSQGSLTVREIVRADRPGVQRYPVWYQSQGAGAVPVPTAVFGCRVGRSVQAVERHLLVVEMILTRPLAQGETALLEHRVETTDSREPVTWWARGVSRPVQEIHLEVRYPADDRPSGVDLIFHEPAGERHEQGQLLGSTVHLQAFQFGPGTCGLRWRW